MNYIKIQGKDDKDPVFINLEKVREIKINSTEKQVEFVFEKHNYLENTGSTSRTQTSTHSRKFTLTDAQFRLTLQTLSSGRISFETIKP